MTTKRNPKAEQPAAQADPVAEALTNMRTHLERIGALRRSALNASFEIVELQKAAGLPHEMPLTRWWDTETDYELGLCQFQHGNEWGAFKLAATERMRAQWRGESDSKSAASANSAWNECPF